ncbi:MAG: bifunctional glycosyltransferase family 2/GtrA family protein [Clostridia bacterium]|nr:bifunctional glycosyltransferase family 2/GtrA family protein [Clostridia bacterium]
MNLNDIAIIIPSLNPDEKFTSVVSGMMAAGFTRFVLVDDGSDKNHKEPFRLAEKYPMVTVLTHTVNLGKGQALKDAFNFVYDNLPDVEAVITIDGDGQHKPEDAKRLADRLSEKPNEVVFGCRNFNEKNVPTRNKLGNKITSLVFRLFFKFKLSDTQTGLRGIPRKYLKDFAEKVEGTRFEYESNMLLYMNDEKIPYSEVSIATLYIEENKSSHFNPIKDSIRIYKPIIKKATGFKFIITGGICTLIDLALYTICMKSISLENIWLLNILCNTIARVISAILNYLANYKFVFCSKAPVLKGAPKYLLIAAGKVLVSWVIQTPVFNALHITGFLCTIIKCIVDVILAFISYFVQKKWIFKE